MDILKLFGKRIKELRKKQGITQEQLAELIGVFPKQIGNIETGTCFTTMANLVKISDVFKVEVKDLFVFSHTDDANEIKKEISSLLSMADEKELRLIYRLIKDVLQ